MSTAARKQKQLNECLLWAADKNDTEKLRYYLKEGATVDKTDPYRRTSLIKATQYGNLDSFESLISYGASVDKADVDGETALTHASYKGCFDILCRLVELGANVNHKNKNDETPLYIASKYGHYDCVRRLVMVDGDYTVQSKKTLQMQQVRQELHTLPLYLVSQTGPIKSKITKILNSEENSKRKVPKQGKQMFRKIALDVAIESLCKAKKLKKEEKCKQLERIVEILSDADEIQALRKQEKMFTLTPEEFRICLERSEYRPSDVNVRVIGLNDQSTMVVTRALIRQSTYSNNDEDIENGINIYNGMCELNIETGEWITHGKIADEDLVHRNMGEVVRHYVNTHDFKTEAENEASLKRNKQSLLFRSNTVFEPELPLKPFSLSPHLNGLRNNSSSNLLLPRSATSTSLYSLKSERSVVSLCDMDIKMASGSTGNFPNVDEHVSSDGAQVRFKQFVSNTKKNFVKAAQTIQQKMDTLIHGETSETGNLDPKGALVKNRKHVYETFEHVKRLMDTDNSNLAPISVCSLSTKFEYAAAHKFLFTSSAIYIVVLDLDIEIDGFSSVLSDSSPPVTNKDYIKYLIETVTRRNDDSSDQFSKIIFVVLNSGSNEEGAAQDGSGLLKTITDIAVKTNKCDFVIIDNDLQFTLEDLYIDKIKILTKHISSIACKTIEARRPVPAAWLSLQEVIISTKKNSAKIISQKDVVELCMSQVKHITVPTKSDVEKFIKYQTQNGNLLSLLSDGALNNLCIDISTLYKLVIFFNHVSIMLSNDKYECSPLHEKLMFVSEGHVDKSITKCYISANDPLLRITCSLCLASTNSSRLQSVSHHIELFLSSNMKELAPDGLALQFRNFDQSACLAYRLSNCIQVSLIFKQLACALFDVFPFKRIHGKPIVFKNFVAFTIDTSYCLSISIDADRIILHVTKHTSDNPTQCSSKVEICSSIHEITACTIKQIINVFTTRNELKREELSVEFETCNLTPPCFVASTKLQQIDSYTCSKHGTFVDPQEILSVWNLTLQACPMLDVEKCSNSCEGLSAQSLTETATDSNLCRMIRRMPPRSRQRILNSLRAELKEHTSSNIDIQLLLVLIGWRNAAKQLTMKDIQKKLINCGEQKHIMCMIYRHPNDDHGLINSVKADRLREVALSPFLLNQLAVRLLTRSLFLALELGLDVVEYNQILQQNRNNPVKTTREILLFCQHKTLDEILSIFQEIGIKGHGLDEIISLLSNASHL